MNSLLKPGARGASDRGRRQRHRLFLHRRRQDGGSARSHAPRSGLGIARAVAPRISERAGDVRAGRLCDDRGGPKALAAGHRAARSREQSVDMELALALATENRISAYDAQYVALARQLQTVCVTEDQRLLKTFPESTRTIQAFAGT